MSWRFIEDVKAYAWYVTTTPFKNLYRQLKNSYYDTKKEFHSMKEWSEFLLLLTGFSLILDKLDFAALFFSLALFIRLSFEWRSKRYRHAWKQRGKK